MSAPSTERKTLAQEAPEFDDLPVKRMREIIRDLGTLEHHPGWAYIKMVLESQANQRLSLLARSQPFNVEQMVQQAIDRGEADALLQLQVYPEFLAASMEQDLERRGITLEGEDEENAD